MNTPKQTPETDAKKAIAAAFLNSTLVVEADFSSKLEYERDEAAKQIEAMREAMKEAHEALQMVGRLPVAGMYPDGPCLEREDHKEVLSAIAKLQPFLK
jgi:hypothetical protein